MREWGARVGGRGFDRQSKEKEHCIVTSKETCAIAIILSDKERSLSSSVSGTEPVHKGDDAGISRTVECASHQYNALCVNQC